MNAPRVIPEAVRRVQIEASDPSVSAWVAANAGSGKTHVLAQRVIRLLLAGIDPARILCITFTKAAAANMANRVFGTLRDWTALGDEQLDRAIQEMGSAKPDTERRARARRLFATALETPGGLKVQTIHAFCTRLLHQFPFEANVAARFDVLDEPTELRLLGEISLTVLLEATQAPDGALARAVATAIAEVSDQTFKDVVGEAIRKRDQVSSWLAQDGDVIAATRGLCEELGIGPEDTIVGIESEMVEGPLLPSAHWPRVAAAFRQGSKQDQDQADRLLAALAASDSERASAYLQLFVTGSMTPRQRLIINAAEEPALAELLGREQARVLALLERRKAVACRDRTEALLTVVARVLARYRTEKDRRGLLDYDDLIDKALDLLREDRAAWVHYKLDQGIDHVLIDEAQDTSPKQWELIRLLTAEFFAGAGARLVPRTVFAVGDEKQSIFSFQDAAPRAFAEMRRHYQQSHEVVGLGFEYREFKHSFRSGPNVLGAVDKVFEPQTIHASVTSDAAGIPPHLALPDAKPGLVEIWETLKPEARREIEAWDAPFDDLAETSPQVRLATKIAKRIRRWMGEGARAGDVLVLVRQRGPLFEAIIRALKDQRVPVAGADRLVLTEHIAIMDLMVLADALLLPADDLALATVLKSPLFGLTDDDLFEIAWQRKGSLRAALRVKAPSSARLSEADARLDRYAIWAQGLPFSFYSRVLAAENGRRRFLARLGHEADDALDELLNLALDYEQRETPSVQGFVAWLRTAQTDVKRDMEATRDEVRVMTVHGAKGLEAPIVVLADTTSEPAGPPHRQPRLLQLPTDVPGHANRLVWARGQATDVPKVATARKAARREAEDEYRRLLYVAMTRAIDRLIICGAQGERKPPDGCWWNLVSRALQPVATETTEDEDGVVWRYRLVPEPTDICTNAQDGSVRSVARAHPLPRWLAERVPDAPAHAQPLSPSRAHDETAPRGTGGSSVERRRAMARGVLMHRLLQSLPDIPAGVRIDYARRHLDRNAHEFEAAERTEMIVQIERLLNDPRYAALFLPGSRAEVPIVGRAIGGRLVSGQIDRLAVSDLGVLIGDYKTNATPPRRFEEAPPAYVRQLALYRAVLAQLYPCKPVKALLIWTYTADAMEIPAAAMDREIAALTSP
ncbi:MAG: double-strand break repair helicase AddA [Hyphomicrobiales bacterium]|nr:double-strand break repair helicase AddA [Hyphomicrobiales bacterium]